MNLTPARVTRLVCLIVWSVTSWGAHAAAPQGVISQERWFVYASLLGTHDSDLIRLAAKGIERDSVTDRRITDMAARVLTEQMDGTRLLNADTVSWLAKALGASGSRRYSALLERLIAHRTGNVVEHATLALAKLTEDGPLFAIDDVDWKAIGAEVASTAESNRQDRRLYRASMGMSIEEVVSMLGYPTSVETAARTRRASYARFSVNDLLFAFEGRGSVEFVHLGGEWRTSVISPDQLPSHIADEGTVVAKVRKGLLGDSFREFRHVATVLEHEEIFDATTLDLAAWRLQSHYRATKEFFVDGLAYVCLALGASGNARYRPLLELVASDAATNKLKRHAKSALADIPPGDAEPFPGILE